jgi:hypothetical protein
MADWDIRIVEVSSLEASASGNLDALHAMIEANADSLASLHASLEGPGRFLLTSRPPIFSG